MAGIEGLHNQQSTATRTSMTPVRSALLSFGEESASPRAAASSRVAAHTPPGPGPELPGDRPVETPEGPVETPVDSPEEHPDSVPPQAPPSSPPEMPEMPRSGSGRVAWRAHRRMARFVQRPQDANTRQDFQRDQKCFQHARTLLPFKNSPLTNMPIPASPDSASSITDSRGNAGSMRPEIPGCVWHMSTRRAA